MLKLQQKFNISSEVLTQEIDGETVILDLNSEGYFGLDKVGTRIWQLLQNQISLQRIIETLLNEYEVEEKKLILDIKSLINKLLDEGLISIYKG